ncbi:MAG: putative O-glycosylation ligase, exosortase A system-associated [Deltaproteobacteria bacterium]|nr:putative O-glycosylation ligase, exosortase A system-associated [Deltaproteobacteria bacterium]
MVESMLHATVAFAQSAGPAPGASMLSAILSLDGLLTLLIVALLPLCALRPWIGVLVFAWIGYMNPHRLLDGFAFHMPYAKLVAAATLCGLLVTRERYALPRTREVYLVAALWVIFVASTLLVALQPAVAREKLAEISKIFLMTGVTLVLFQDRYKLTALVLVIALSVGLLGAGGALWGLSTGFAERLYGPPRSFLGDNNAFGYTLTIVLPIIALARRQAERRWLRRVLLAVFALSIVAVFATWSRGALIGLCLSLPLLLAWSWRRDPAILLATAAACLAIYATPRPWVERMQTITPTAYRDTSSGSKRMASWYVALRLGLDHPILGAGFRPFEPDVYERYMPGYWDNHDAHNHYLQLFAEHGVPGLLLFVALLGSLFLTLWRTRRATRGDPPREWIGEAAQLVAVSLVAYAVGGIFLNMPYFDLFYQLAAVGLILQQAARAPGLEIAAPCAPLLSVPWARRRPAAALSPARAGG